MVQSSRDFVIIMVQKRKFRGLEIYEMSFRIKCLNLHAN